VGTALIFVEGCWLDAGLGGHTDVVCSFCMQKVDERRATMTRLITAFQVAHS
jgi:hypothetical protein